MEKKTKAAPRAKAAASTKPTAAPKPRAATSKAAKPASTVTTAKPRARATKPATGAPMIAKSAAPAAPNREQVAQVAYSLFEQSGHQHGRSLEHWLEAESRLSRGMKL